MYDGNIEIASFTPDQKLKELRVLGLTSYQKYPLAVAFEVEDKIYAPVPEWRYS